MCDILSEKVFPEELKVKHRDRLIKIVVSSSLIAAVGKNLFQALVPARGNNGC